jgi:hypothetical protein
MLSVRERTLNRLGCPRDASLPSSLAKCVAVVALPPFPHKKTCLLWSLVDCSNSIREAISSSEIFCKIDTLFAM